MLKKKIVNIFFISLTLFFRTNYCVDSNLEDLKNKSKALDIVLALDTGIEYNTFKAGNTPPVASNVNKAIKDNIPFITSSHILYIIKNKKGFYNSIKLIKDNYRLYENKDKDFIIGLPNKYFSNQESLNYLGINEDVLDPINLSNFESDLEKYIDFLPKDKKINLDNLKKLLINPYSKKKIYLVGHGSFSGELIKDVNPSMAEKIKAAIAGLDLDQYSNFLTFLNDIGTEFLYVSSCYAGGLNILKYQEYNVKNTNSKDLSYFLVIGSLTDVAASGIEPDFGNFFKELDTFFTLGPKSNNTFKSILKALDLSALENTPSVRFPGNINYFKAVDVDNKIEIITYSKVAAHNLESKLSNINIKPIVIKDKDDILVYPLYIKVPIEILLGESWNLPSIISMIPGPAFHLFSKIDVKETIMIKQLVQDLFFYSGAKIPSEKVFFIEDLNIPYYPELGLPSGKLKNVVIDKKPGNYKSILIAKADDQFYKADITWDAKNLNPINFELISHDKAKELIMKILLDIKNKTLKEAVMQASGGQESIDDIYKKILNIFI